MKKIIFILLCFAVLQACEKADSAIIEKNKTICEKSGGSFTEEWFGEGICYCPAGPYGDDLYEEMPVNCQEWG